MEPADDFVDVVGRTHRDVTATSVGVERSGAVGVSGAVTVYLCVDFVAAVRGR